MRKELIVAAAAVAGAILAAFLFARRAEATIRLSPAGPFPGPLGGPAPEVFDVNSPQAVCGNSPRCLCDQFDICD